MTNQEKFENGLKKFQKIEPSLENGMIEHNNYCMYGSMLVANNNTLLSIDCDNYKNYQSIIAKTGKCITYEELWNAVYNYCMACCGLNKKQYIDVIKNNN